MPEERNPQDEETQRCYEMDVLSLETFVAESVRRHKNMCLCFPAKNTVPRRSELQMDPVTIAELIESHDVGVPNSRSVNSVGDIQGNEWSKQ